MAFGLLPRLFCFGDLAIYLKENYNNVRNKTFLRKVMAMKKVQVFISKNKWITGFFIFSVLIIVSYILTMDWPELFDGAEEWYNLFFQLSVGYIINFMFYITQVYIPGSKRDATIRECISKRISKLRHDMDASLSQLAKVYAKDHSGNAYSDEELKLLLNMRFSDTVNVLKASASTMTSPVYFTVREWLAKCIADTEKDIDDLFKYYDADISVNLMNALEEIPRCALHSGIKMLLRSPNEVDFSTTNFNFFAEYYQLIQKLEKIQKEDYS